MVEEINKEPIESNRDDSNDAEGVNQKVDEVKKVKVDES